MVSVAGSIAHRVMGQREDYHNGDMLVATAVEESLTLGSFVGLKN